MTKKNEIYKCNVCGNIVEVLHTGVGRLVCCGELMVLQKENTVEGVGEKHIPVVDRQGSEAVVTVGAVEHPMEEKHYIEWIEIIEDGVVRRKNLNPGDKPQVTFCVKSDNITVRAYCNVHGLWVK